MKHSETGNARKNRAQITGSVEGLFISTAGLLHAISIYPDVPAA